MEIIIIIIYLYRCAPAFLYVWQVCAVPVEAGDGAESLGTGGTGNCELV